MPTIISIQLLNRGSAKTHSKDDAPLKGMSIDNLVYASSSIGHELQTHHPALVMLEDYSGGNTHNAFILACTGEVTGAAKLWMHQEKIPWREVASGTLKKYTTGFGGGKKELMWKGAYKRWGIEESIIGDDNNVLDAYCLARMGLDLVAFEEGSTDGFVRYEVESFRKLRLGGAPRRFKGTKDAAA